MTFDATQKIAELEREVADRKRRYPGIVVKGSMTIKQARDRIAILEEIAHDYRAHADARPTATQEP